MEMLDSNMSIITLISRRCFVIRAGAATAALAGAGLAACAKTPSADNVVYKTPTCGCCAAWVEHVKRAGIEIRVVNLPDISAERARLGAPADLASCHIALIDGYVIEGHVPVDAVKELISTRPDAIGLFVPGMPIGSPGMESAQGVQPFDVILLDKAGSRSVFARYGG